MEIQSFQFQVSQNDKVKILSNRSRFSLNCLSADNYPEFSESELSNSFFISARKLKKSLDKTLFCMANQDVRYYLNGLLLHISNSKIKLVASDGHRFRWRRARHAGAPVWDFTAGQGRRPHGGVHPRFH